MFRAQAPEEQLEELIIDEYGRGMLQLEYGLGMLHLDSELRAAAGLRNPADAANTADHRDLRAQRRLVLRAREHRAGLLLEGPADLG